MNKFTLEEQLSEMQDVVASIQCQYEIFRAGICQILLENEPTVVGNQITIDRIKECVNFLEWCEDNADV